MAAAAPPIAEPALRPGGWSGEARATLALAWPLAAANLLQMLIYAVDVIFIARLGADELAASALTVSIFGLFVWSLSGLTGAVAAVASAEIGARPPALAPVRRSMRMALWLAVLASLPLMALCAFAEPFMLATGQAPRIAALAGDYMDLLLWALAPGVVASVLRNFVSTLERPIFATLVAALAIGVNAFANWVLIFGNLGAPALGLEGAAIATICTNIAMVAAYALAIALDPRLARYRLLARFWRPDWDRMRQLLRIGTPIAFTTAAEAGVFGAAAFLMGLIGPTQLAAHTLALQIAALAFMVPMGVAQAATIRVGFYYGARDRFRAARAGWTGIAMGTAFMVVTASAMLFAPRALLSIYVDADAAENAAMVEIATRFMLVAAAFQLFDGVQVVAAGALRGLQDTRVPMWIAILAYWIPGFGLAAALGFATPLAGLGVWIGLAVGLACAAVPLLLRWRRREALGLI